MNAKTPLAPFTLPDDGGVPPLPDGFALDPHPAQPSAANDDTPPLPAGFTPDAPMQTEGQLQAGDDPNRVASRMAPEDNAVIERMLRAGDADSARSYAHHHGFGFPNAEQLVAFYKANPNAPSTGETYQLPAATSTRVQAFGDGLSQGASLGTSDEIHGVLNGIGALAKGGSFGDAYDRTVDQDRAQLGADERDHSLLSLAGNIAGGIALPLGLERTGLSASARAIGASARDAAIASGVAPAAADKIAAQAIARRIAAEGAAYGGAYGAGSSDGTPGQRLLAGAEGAAGGALTGVAAGRIGETLAARAANKAMAAVPAADVMQAADRQGIDLLPADVGGPMTRRLTGAAAQAPLSASPVIKAAQATIDQSQAARDRVAAAVGQALDPEGAGLAVRTGAQKYIASSGQDVRNAYRLAELAAGDTKVAPTNALASLDRNIAELSETPGGAPGLDRMQGLRDELAKGDVSPAGLLRMRTTLRDQFMQDGLRGSDTERRIGQVLDAAGQDVADGLSAAGKPEASQAYSRAATLYKNRVSTIDTVLKPIIGTKDAPRSGEQITKSLMADLQGNNARAVKLMRSLPAEDRATAQASIIGSLGNASAGRQNAEGTAFSLSQFLTQWNKVGTTAKRALFSDESRSALDDLAKVADATKQAQGYANHSNSPAGIWGNIGALASGATLAPHAAAAGAVMQLVGGRLLASPRFARWLARAPRTALGAPAYIERLGRIAKAEPAIAPQLMQLQQHLTQQQAAGQ